jgi:hypothetical protein
MSGLNGHGIFEKVKSIITEQLGVEGEEIAATTSFEELNADSLDIVELIMAFEEAQSRSGAYLPLGSRESILQPCLSRITAEARFLM